jgi:Ribonuclease G/E
MTDEERMETTGTGRGGNGATAAGSGGEDWEERARRAEAALEEALAERNRLWEELHQRAANENELDHYRRLAATIETSASWRLTRPVRDAKRVAISGRAGGRKVAAKIRGKLQEGR